MKHIIILLLILLIFTTGCGIVKYNPPEEKVGGDKDEYGCIGSAGYMWCETLQECVRPWETYCESNDGNYNTEHNQNLAIELASPYLMEKPMYANNGRLLKIEEVAFMRCLGCFSVYYNFIIDNENNEVQKVKVRVDINNWETTIAEFTMDELIEISKAECEYNGGEVKQKDCEDNEIKTAMVSGYSTPRICCVENE